MTQESFQQRVYPWLIACFGEAIAADREERNHRFLEESVELVQACGCTRSEAHQLVDYVFNRPVGEKSQEVGGVMVTLAALCLAQDLNMHDNGEVELTRIWTMVEKIRAKQAAKPKHSPLPEAKDQPIAAFDVDQWRGQAGSAVRNYASACVEDNEAESNELLELVNTLLRRGHDTILDLQLQLSVAGTNTAAYFAGQDAAFAGIVERWTQALSDPIPKAGVMNEPLEGLYRRTEELRRKRNLALTFITQCAGMSGGMVNGNKLAQQASDLLREMGEC